jgi:hypothetical protein
VPDEVVREHRPVTLGEQRTDRVLDLDGVGLLGPAEAAGQPAEVGVDGDAGDVECVAEHDVGGLAAHARQLHEVLEAARDLPVVMLHQVGGELEQRLGLGAEEAQRPDDALEGLAVGGGHRASVGVGGEERGSHGVDPLVGGLRRQHGHHQQLERVVEVELAAGVGVGLGEDPLDATRPPGQCEGGLRGRHADTLRDGTDTPRGCTSQVRSRPRETPARHASPPRCCL